jgi:hypothetical protein
VTWLHGMCVSTGVLFCPHRLRQARCPSRSGKAPPASASCTSAAPPPPPPSRLLPPPPPSLPHSFLQIRRQGRRPQVQPPSPSAPTSSSARFSVLTLCRRYSRVHCVFNAHNLWANVSRDDSVAATAFDLHNPTAWKSMDASVVSQVFRNRAPCIKPSTINLADIERRRAPPLPPPASSPSPSPPLSSVWNQTSSKRYHATAHRRA